MASRRLSPAYVARNLRAQALGYRNYYDYRIHGHGTVPPDRPAPTGETRQRLRGHRGPADLLRTNLDGALLTVTDHSERDSQGRYRWVELTVVDARGRQRTYRLSGRSLQGDRLQRTISAAQAAGGVLSPSPSLDLANYMDADPENEEWGQEAA